MQFFYCDSGKIGELTGVILVEKHSSDAGAEAPDAVSVRPVCRQCLAQLGLGTGHQAQDEVRPYLSI